VPDALRAIVRAIDAAAAASEPPQQAVGWRP
jgi:hypothetical protein